MWEASWSSPRFLCERWLVSPLACFPLTCIYLRNLTCSRIPSTLRRAGTKPLHHFRRTLAKFAKTERIDLNDSYRTGKRGRSCVHGCERCSCGRRNLEGLYSIPLWYQRVVLFRVWCSSRGAKRLNNCWFPRLFSSYRDVHEQGRT